MDTILNAGEGNIKDARATWASRNPMGRMGSVGELDGICVLLASKIGGSYINGTDHIIDGKSVLYLLERKAGSSGTLLTFVDLLRWRYSLLDYSWQTHVNHHIEDTKSGFKSCHETAHTMHDKNARQLLPSIPPRSPIIPSRTLLLQT